MKGGYYTKYYYFMYHTVAPSSIPLNNNYTPACDGLVSASVRQLMFAFHGLIFKNESNTINDEASMKNFRIDLRPTSAYHRAKKFLLMLDETAQVLQLRMVNRDYRMSYTMNYKTLLPSDRRSYRCDVLEAAIETHEALWVNGVRHAVSQDVLDQNIKFLSSWFNLLDKLKNIQISFNQNNKATNCKNCVMQDQSNSENHVVDYNTRIENGNDQNNRNECTNQLIEECQYCTVDWLYELGWILVQFDISWVNFERSYICELIGIERQARQLLMDCIYTEEELQIYEDIHYRVQGKRDSEEIRSTLERFISEVGALNAVANNTGKMNDKFYVSVYNALIILNESKKRVNNNYSDWINGDQTHWVTNLTDDELKILAPVAKPLANKIMDLRIHLRQLGVSVEKIDPHLSHNHQLVKELEELHEALEPASKWIHSNDTAQSILRFIFFMSEIIDIDNQCLKKKQKHIPDENNTLLFESRLASLDVAALLAVPRSIVLFICTDSNDHYLLTSLLSDSSGRQYVSGECLRNNKQRPELLSGIQFFQRIQNIIKNNNSIPHLIHKVVKSGEEIARICLETERTNECCIEDTVLKQIIRRIINDNETVFEKRILSVEGLSNAINVFFNAIEEVAIALQRTDPQEWNSFLHNTIECLLSLRSRPKENLNNEEE